MTLIPLPSHYELQTKSRDELRILHESLVEELSEVDLESGCAKAIHDLLDQIERILCNAPISSHTCYNAP